MIAQLGRRYIRLQHDGLTGDWIGLRDQMVGFTDLDGIESVVFGRTLLLLEVSVDRAVRATPLQAVLSIVADGFERIFLI